MTRAWWARVLLLLLALLALGVLLTVREEPLYGTSCSTDEECERQDGGVRIVGVAAALL